MDLPRLKDAGVADLCISDRFPCTDVLSVGRWLLIISAIDPPRFAHPGFNGSVDASGRIRRSFKPNEDER